MRIEKNTMSEFFFFFFTRGYEFELLSISVQSSRSFKTEALLQRIILLNAILEIPRGINGTRKDYRN
jgi:hypothetical protein